MLVTLLVASTVFAQPSDVRQRVATDAMVIDRLAEVATKRELPTDLLKRIVTEDIELMRGRRNDGSYEYATWERFEASRVKEGFSVQARADKMETLEVKGVYVYRVIIDAANRKLLVRKNRPVWIERLDLEYIAVGSSQVERQTVDVKAWMQPGDVRPIDLPVIARQVTAKVIATAEEKGGYANVTIALVQARIVDNADSPYADAVASAKAMQRALDNNELPSLRAMAQRVRDSVGGSAAAAVPVIAGATPSRPATSSMTVTAPARDLAAQVELQAELQLIEDLLTGNESEKREGMDRLHQLIRKMR
ncbi:MAG TPA: hypothetical protein VHW00_19145 [Thermoanaerobaculia bacterium]|nr:hypothetical protein [Thermoanaerobaculia bacterium]